jgi:hypothetical protein
LDFRLFNVHLILTLRGDIALVCGLGSLLVMIVYLLNQIWFFILRLQISVDVVNVAMDEEALQ